MLARHRAGQQVGTLRGGNVTSLEFWKFDDRVIRVSRALFERTRETMLVWFLLYLRDAFIDRFATRIAFVDAVPVGNLFLTHFPAEQGGVTVNHTGKSSRPISRSFTC